MIYVSSWYLREECFGFSVEVVSVVDEVLGGMYIFRKVSGVVSVSQYVLKLQFVVLA